MLFFYIALVIITVIVKKITILYKKNKPIGEIMKIHIISEQVGLEGYWITDILDGIAKESLKKNITIVDYDGSAIDLSPEAPRPIVLAIGYSMHWMEKTCEELKQNNILPVLVNADNGLIAEMLGPVGTVSFGIRRSVYEVLSYLVAIKRSKIAFFGAHLDVYADDIKAEEFLHLVNFWGLDISAKDIYRSDKIDSCFDKIKPFLENYNAVFCTSDAAAAFLIEKCHDMGLRVPQDIAIIGFGNARFSERFSPTITTVENNHIELGRQAVKLHQLLQKNTDINSASISVDCPLILRQSTPGAIPSNHTAIIKNECKVPSYEADPDFMRALMAEELLKNWDDIDKAIAFGLVHNKTVVSIAEGLYISVSAVKYRIKKMLISTDLKTKAELAKLIKKYNLI